MIVLLVIMSTVKYQKVINRVINRALLLLTM